MAALAKSPRRLGWLVPMAIATVVALLPFIGVVDLSVQRELQLAAIYGLIVAGFNLGFGFGGQLALGQVAVFAGGAYATAILYSHGTTELTIAIVVSVAFAAVLGLITGLPGLRFSEWVLALVAFFLIVLIPSLTSLLKSETGGVIGIPGIQGATLFGQPLSNDGFYVVTVAVCALVLLFYRNLVDSRYGHGLLVLKQGSALARSLGLSPFRLRLSAYLLSGLPAGLAGVFYAYYATYIQTNLFDFNLVTLILAASIIGGTRSMWAAPIACAILVIVPDRVSAFDKYSVLAYGLFLTLAGVGFSAGLAGLGRGLLARIAPRGAVVEPPDDATAATGSEAPLAIAGATLTTKGVTKAFGGVQALQGVDFEAKPGAITAIIGANGAGKTTLLNAISGLVPPDDGEVRLDDRAISGLAAATIARAGIARTFQTPQIPETLTVLDVAASSRIGERWVPAVAVGLRTPPYATVRDEDAARALAALRFVGLHGEAHVIANALPLGRRRVLEVARCIAAEPSVVLFDEPAAGLDPEALESLRDVLIKLRDAGATVVLIEHNVTFVMDVADTVFVMGLGAVIASGAPEAVRNDETVIASYLGRRHGGHEPEPVRAGDGD